MIDNTQKQIIRQSSLKASIDFWKLKCSGGCEDITEEDVIKTASRFGSYCATGQMPEKSKGKLLK